MGEAREPDELRQALEAAGEDMHEAIRRFVGVRSAMLTGQTPEDAPELIDRGEDLLLDPLGVLQARARDAGVFLVGGLPEPTAERAFYGLTQQYVLQDLDEIVAGLEGLSVDEQSARLATATKDVIASAGEADKLADLQVARLAWRLAAKTAQLWARTEVLRGRS